MAGRILIVGLGRFGTALAETLGGLGYEVMAVDREMDAVAGVRDRVAYAVQLDAVDPEALRSIDAHTCSIAIVTMGESFESAVLAVAALREIGIPEVIARSRSPRKTRILTAVGAAQVVEIEGEMGRRLAESLADRTRAARS